MKRRILSLILVLMLAAALLVLGSCDDVEYRSWELIEDNTVLTDGTSRYERVDIPKNYRIENNIFYYGEGVYIELVYFDVAASSHESSIYYLEAMSYQLFAAFTDAEGKAELEKFLSGDYTTARLYSALDSLITETDSSFVSALDALGGSTATFDVSELGNVPREEIWLFGPDDALMYVHGAIYTVEGQDYYVNYSRLDNSHFDSNGNFSYRQGSIQLTPIGSSLAAQLDSYENSSVPYSIKYTFENEIDIEITEPEAMSPVVARAILVLLILIFGIILPIVPLGYAVYKLFVKRISYAAPSYILFIASLVWAVMGIAALILVLV